MHRTYLMQHICQSTSVQEGGAYLVRIPTENGGQKKASSMIAPDLLRTRGLERWVRGMISMISRAPLGGKGEESSASRTILSCCRCRLGWRS